jgi:DNA-binding LytR/AlgR family response regulator
VEESTRHLPFLFRCHRAYIVNLDRVTNIGGNAQGYRLSLSNNPEVVPVSRAKGVQLQQLIHRIR